MNNLGVVVVVDLKDAGQELSAFEVFTLVYFKKKPFYYQMKLSYIYYRYLTIMFLLLCIFPSAALTLLFRIQSKLSADFQSPAL